MTRTDKIIRCSAVLLSFATTDAFAAPAYHDTVNEIADATRISHSPNNADNFEIDLKIKYEPIDNRPIKFRGITSEDYYVDASDDLISPTPLEAVAAFTPTDQSARAESAAFGAKVKSNPFDFSLAGFWLRLDSEHLFLDEFDASGQRDVTRRYGVLARSTWRPYEWISVDVTAGFVNARYAAAVRDNSFVSNAAKTLVTAGVTLRPISDIAASFDMAYLDGVTPEGEMSAIDKSSPTLGFALTYNLGPTTLGLEIQNLLNENAPEGAYFYSVDPFVDNGDIANAQLEMAESRLVFATLQIDF